MRILIPDCPSDFIYELHSSNCSLHLDNLSISQNVSSLLIFNIISGRYFCCYNENGKEILCIKLSSKQKGINIIQSKEIILCTSIVQ
jgi:hypothetical protein